MVLKEGEDSQDRERGCLWSGGNRCRLCSGCDTFFFCEIFGLVWFNLVWVKMEWMGGLLFVRGVRC